MLKLILVAALLAVSSTAHAGRRPMLAPQCNAPGGFPCEVGSQNAKTKVFFAGLLQPRVRKARITPQKMHALEDLMGRSAGAILRPSRYIAGRLICAVNVNSALAERGIRGTGSALALSFLRWGSASAPVPGAVAVSHRRGGGHVAIVSRVSDGQVWVWNPSPRGRGWQEIRYRHRGVFRSADAGGLL